MDVNTFGQIYKAFNGKEREWCIISKSGYYTKHFMVNSFSELLSLINAYGGFECEISFSVQRFSEEKNMVWWSFIIDVDGKDELVKQSACEAICRLLNNFDLFYLLDNRYHIWFPDWETVLVNNWYSLFGSQILNFIKLYIEKVCKMKDTIIDKALWSTHRHKIRMPYSIINGTNNVQKFIEEFETKYEVRPEDYLSMWNGEALDNPNIINCLNLDYNKTTHYYASNFVNFISVATEYGKQLQELSTQKLYFKPERIIKKAIRPCLKTLPKDPSHFHRLAIVWEYLNNGYSVDETTKLFESVPDFKRERTLYQVEYAKKKGYKPYSCSKLFELGICLRDECDIFRKVVKVVV